MVAALRDWGSLPDDRIEHAAIIPAELLCSLRDLRVRVVTQPDFIRARGEAYGCDVDPRDLDSLYRYRSLVAHGVPTAPSSDAPFGELDPWRIMRSATERRTAAGALLGPDERVSARMVLDGYLSPPDAPGGPPRRLTAGMPANVVLLHVPLSEALTAPDASWVRRSFVRSVS